MTVFHIIVIALLAYATIGLLFWSLVAPEQEWWWGAAWPLTLPITAFVFFLMGRARK